MEPLFPRRGLLCIGIALVSAALHWIVGSAMLSYLVHCCVSQACWMLAYAVSARKPARKLVTDEVLHPIGKIQPLLIGLNLP